MTEHSLSNLPSDIYTAEARLPQSYEDARYALANCEKLDECKSWADKASALASYAKMADDDELEKMAIRIKARAIRRCGELLRDFNGRGNNQHSLDSGDTPTIRNNRTPSQNAIAREAGLSKDQQVQAVRVAKVPEQDFEDAVSAEKPATITKLAEMGKGELYRPKPEGYAQATQFLGALDYYEERCLDFTPDYLVGGLNKPEIKPTVTRLRKIIDWSGQMISALEKNS